MSNNFPHKIYNYEVSPPADTWQKIAAALDESHLTDKFPSRIYNTQTNPPAGAWEAIAASLAELHLSHQYPATLYNLEAAPPATAWENIKASLEDKDEVAIPRRRRIAPVLRYAAAAIFIGAVAFGAVKILGINKAGNVEATANETPSSVEKNNPGPGSGNEAITPSNEETARSEESRNDAALEESKHVYASLGTSDRQRMKKVSDDFFQSAADPVDATADLNPASTYQDLSCSEVTVPAYAGGPSSIDMASRYSMLMTPDGRIIRISKKLGDLFCCVSGEEVDDDCKDQLKKWRQKIADSPVAPSPENFMDILDLLHTLKDNR